MFETNTILLLFIMCCTTEAICPLDCTCRLDETGRRKTSCLQGGLIGPVPVNTIDISTQVLQITSRDDNPNYINIIPNFQKLTNLIELHITSSHIQEIGKHSFWGVKNLEVLNLMKNNISQLQEHNFRGLANLRELYLNDNNIESLSTGTFKYLTDLKILSLARNRIGELVERAFERMSKLQKLNLSGNRLAELNPQIFMDVQELKVLECRRCGLRNINPQIYNLLPHLTSLDLGENDFHFLQYDEFQDLRKLKYLWLDGNRLSVVLEKSFILQRELQKLSFARNRLAKVTNTAFFNVSTLIELDLSYNKLYRLEPVIFHPIAESLQKLYISGNKVPVTDIKGVLQTLGNNIRQISMADMRFKEIPIDLFSNQRLQYLNLSGNNLSTFPIEVFKTLPNLVELDLSRNNFTGFSERLMTKFERIAVLHFEKNPWGCDLCNIIPMLNRINKTIGSYLRTLKCASPRYLSQRTLESLLETELRWCGELDDDPAEGTLLNFFKNNGFIIVISVTSVGVLVVLIGTIAVIRCCFKRTTGNLYFEEDKDEDKPRSQTQETVLDSATAIFGQNGEISFKFPLELTERKMSVSTIDVKKEGKSIPNGEL